MQVWPAHQRMCRCECTKYTPNVDAQHTQSQNVSPPRIRCTYMMRGAMYARNFDCAVWAKRTYGCKVHMHSHTHWYAKRPQRTRKGPKHLHKSLATRRRKGKPGAKQQGPTNQAAEAERHQEIGKKRYNKYIKHCDRIALRDKAQGKYQRCLDV